MSITLIVVISALMASLIGLKIYFENKQEEQLKAIENTEEVFDDLKTIVVNATEPALTVEQPTVVDFTPTTEEVKPVDQTVAEVKPKKKRRYYGKPKAKKQTKNKS